MTPREWLQWMEMRLEISGARLRLAELRVDRLRVRLRGAETADE